MAAEQADAAIARIESRGGLRWERHQRGRWAVPARVSITKARISMTATAWEAIGGPAAVELLFERSQRLVGIRPADPKSAGAYPTRRPSKVAHSRVVTAAAFVARYDLPKGQYPVRVLDGMLVVPLRDPLPSRRRRGED